MNLAPIIKPIINIGALMDIPTGEYVKGKYGEHILNGGLATVTGVVGIGNNFKSTITHYMTGMAMARMGSYSSAMTYDTEVNIHENHIASQMYKIEEFGGENVIDSGRWSITDRTVYTADQWYDKFREFLDYKKTNAKKYTVLTPFADRDKTQNFKIIVPTFAEVDSMSEFTTKDVVKMQEDTSLGDAGANMVYMRQGIQKNRFLMEIPSEAGATNTYVLMTSHMGTEYQLDPYAPKIKKLEHIKSGMKLKGVPEKFTFVTNNCWHASNAKPLRNKSTRAAEYPKDKDDTLQEQTDLCTVEVIQLRSKSGITGLVQELVVSQIEGVLPSLTEFHFLKTKAGRHGFLGNDINYKLAYCPDINLSRTTVRSKIDDSYALRRCINFLSEQAQMIMFWNNLDPIYTVDPVKVYEELTNQGYDWNVLLNTRGWWTIIGQHTDKEFLSTYDLLRMYHGLYIPYWMESPPAKAIEKYESVNKVKWSPSELYLKDKKVFQQLTKEVKNGN